MSWLPLSYDESTGQGTYLMRMDPGAVTIAHDHAGMEEFLIIEGDLVDSDGKAHQGSSGRRRAPGRCDTALCRERLEARRPNGIHTRESRSWAMRRAASSAAPSRRSRPG